MGRRGSNHAGPGAPRRGSERRRRYNHDGYGQKDDGSAFNGSGTGRCWPLLTGERSHYELVHWSSDDWANVTDQPTQETALGCWFADLPTARLAANARIVFTLRWEDRWEGRDFTVRVGLAS